MVVELHQPTIATAKWNAFMLSMMELGAGLANGGNIYVRGIAYILLSVAVAIGVAGATNTINL